MKPSPFEELLRAGHSDAIQRYKREAELSGLVRRKIHAINDPPFVVVELRKECVAIERGIYPRHVYPVSHRQHLRVDATTTNNHHFFSTTCQPYRGIRRVHNLAAFNIQPFAGAQDDIPSVRQRLADLDARGIRRRSDRKGAGS